MPDHDFYLLSRTGVKPAHFVSAIDTGFKTRLKQDQGVTTLPAVEKALSEGTEVATQPNQFLASSISDGYL
ncbi:hypothetical protein PHYSODRAFT_337629 [Phytophthora sojae]|uniref:Uncharacterized protein n=1 Tax=Phytophthora sojae (strain P6497) TaxID=1094619 RepID=G5A1R0_PHYSP|nr:hypothetical protein PHYSODRAFT_337629 [Phytophthora sojae]EGZ10858.1 hypothetical protein PHYSODRAFT_337629 [Phytophthora sojae]|eukprot:XP_009533603.1 hypothetical protein PHYSODRAFT_337629 [Phytophthora sojae]